MTLSQTMADLARFYEENAPELWHRCYPRIYGAAGPYCSPKYLAAELCRITSLARPSWSDPEADKDFAQLLGDDDADKARKFDVISAHKLIGLGVPTFFVAPELFTALAKTSPPQDIEWQTMRLPFESAAFIFPRGAFSHSETGEYSHVWYARVRCNDSVKTEGRPPLVAKENLFCVRTEQRIKGSCRIASFAINDAAPLRPRDVDQQLLDNGSISPKSEDREVLATLNNLVWNFIFLLLERPTLVEHGTTTGKHSKRGQAFWTPNVLGGRYKYQRASTAEAAHGGWTVRMHWRRGHWRLQPCGPNHSERIDKWIEPILVHGEDTPS